MQLESEKKMNSSESLYEKLYLVPKNTYKKIMQQCDNEERTEISNINETFSEDPLSIRVIQIWQK